MTTLLAKSGNGVRTLREHTSDVMNAAEQTTWDDTPATPPTLQVVTDAYEAGETSVADLTPPALDAIMDQMFAEWQSMVAQAGGKMKS